MKLCSDYLGWTNLLAHLDSQQGSDYISEIGLCSCHGCFNVTIISPKFWLYFFLNKTKQMLGLLFARCVLNSFIWLKTVHLPKCNGLTHKLSKEKAIWICAVKDCRNANARNVQVSRKSPVKKNPKQAVQTWAGAVNEQYLPVSRYHHWSTLEQGLEVELLSCQLMTPCLCWAASRRECCATIETPLVALGGPAELVDEML